MSDIDVLVHPAQKDAAIALLQGQGYRLRGPLDALRADLDDQLPLADPAGAIFDLHWRIVTGGWRFREVVRHEEAALWRRAQRVTLEGLPAWVMAPADQLLHLASHLMLSGATGLVWWQDVRRFLEYYGERLDWSTVLSQAKAARLRTMAWLVLDTLWQRWRVPVPPPAVRALRPGLFRRWALRALLPNNLAEAADEPRWQRHLRELLLMDRLRDRLWLLWRWSHPPQAWHAFRRGAVAEAAPMSYS